MGEVVVADGYSSITHRILCKIKSGLPEWKIISDPCFSKTSVGFSSMLGCTNGKEVVDRLANLDFQSVPIPQVTPECLGKEIEYGIN